LSSQRPIYGVLAEFANPTALVTATKRARAEGYTRFEAYTPFPVEELSETIPIRYPVLPLLVLTGGIIGGLGAFAMMYYASVINYPLNIGGRPLNSWPSFIPITFELTVLGAAFAAVFGVLALSGLPMPYHPLFNVKEFARASQDRFFLCIEANDPKFDVEATTKFLVSLDALGVSHVDD
jgi:hypothetical protein